RPSIKLSPSRSEPGPTGTRPAYEAGDDDWDQAAVEQRRPAQDRMGVAHRRHISRAQFAAEGNTNREIAEKLFISPHTVNTHLRHIFEKLGINSRVHLTRLAAGRSLQSPRDPHADRSP